MLRAVTSLVLARKPLAAVGMLLSLAAYDHTIQLPYGPLALRLLEVQFQRPSMPLEGPVDGIIVLGGGFDRVEEGVLLAQHHPTARLVISGTGEEKSHAYALAHGIPRERLVIEPDSRNTYENAVFTARVLGNQKNGASWLLVTSAAHMPRAIGSFRNAGIDAIAWPTQRPIMDREAQNSVARHEVLGLVAYRLLGRTDAIFPAPEVIETQTAAADAQEPVSSRNAL